jgi:hypothetical protein
VLKFNPNASGPDQLTYCTYLGGSGTDVAHGIDVDAAGRIYVIGTTRSTDFPLTSSAYAGVIYGPQDAFIAMFDLSNSSTLAYSTYLGGELSDDGFAIAVTPSGTVYAAGSTSSTGFPQAGAQYSPTLNGGAYVDGWVAQMDLTKSGNPSLIYSSYLGGGDLDEIFKIAIDPSGKLLVTGYTMSSDFPVTADAFQKTLGGNADAFVARLDFTKPQAGFLDYATYLGGLNGDAGYDIGSDSAGNIYVTGYTLSGNFPITKDAVATQSGAGTDAFIVKLNPALAGAARLVYSTYLGSGGQHVGYGMAVGSDGSMFVGGLTSRQDINVTGNASQVAYAGGLSDGFLIILGP